MYEERTQALLSAQKRYRTVLKQTRIDEHGPGTILHDFNAFIAFLRENEVVLTRSGQLPLRVLPLINQRLARPLNLDLKRPRQKSYPPIHGLYLLVRVSGLTRAVPEKKKTVLKVRDSLYQQWQELKPTEQYFTLLEAWLIRGDESIVGERRRLFTLETLNKLMQFIVRIPEGGWRKAEQKDLMTWLAYMPGWHNLGLLYEFGLIDIEDAPPEPGKGWNIQVVYPTSWGEALLSLLSIELFQKRPLVDLEDTPAIERPGVLQPILQPYFPQWKRVLPLLSWEFRPGTYTFKVSLGEIWRRIAIPAEATLEDLATAILNSVDFDFDHLYMFEYRDLLGTYRAAFHPSMDEGPWTPEVRIGDLPLEPGQSMKFVYDFGRWWEFVVTLEHVDAEKHIARAEIIEEHDKPPAQYGW